jgi:hypothetical protein
MISFKSNRQAHRKANAMHIETAKQLGPSRSGSQPIWQRD